LRGNSGAGDNRTERRAGVSTVIAEDAADRPAARRPGGRSSRVRTRILAATSELVARHGITGFRYEEVAELAGVHKASVYRNWPDRAELVAEALLQHAEELATIADTGDLRRDLVAYLVALADGLGTPFGQALELATRPGHDNPTVRQTVTRILQRRGDALTARVDLSVQRGELPPVDGTFLGELLAGPVRLIVNRGLRAFTETDAERIVDVVIAGIRATATGARMSGAAPASGPPD
jgi:AcrR family transcriptional regulator